MRIVVRQISGLGNQLFQYAAGRYYSRLYGAPLHLALDPARRAFSYGSPRPFLLSHFAIQAAVSAASSVELFLLSTRPQLQQGLKTVQRMLGIQVLREAEADRYTFPADIPLEPWTRTLYVVGYWQTYRFPDSMEVDLRAELVFKHPASGVNLQMLENIRSVRNPVSLHVRRGDYTLAAEGNIALPLDYYDRAIQLMLERVNEPTFFVFSDDMAFARANLPANLNAVFVDHNDGFTAHEDLRLMSSCSHHIIANSSFSWWGAWLNPYADKQVIAPKHWLLRPDSYYPELTPPTWQLLDVLRTPALPPR